MHELSVCMALIGQLEAIAREAGAGAVRRITVAVGPLSGVEPSLLAAAFPHASRGSLAEGARLDIETPPLMVSCDDCGRESAARPELLSCRICGSQHTRLVSGNELTLVSISHDVPDGSESTPDRTAVQHV